ncbi:hypothetical protein OXX79_003888 [Metschnikowia pulcherrima]
MSNCRVKIGAERIGGPGANSHAGVSVSGESRGKPNGFADGSAAGTNPLVRDDSYNDKNTSAHENVEDCDIRITKASANTTHGEREENCDSVFNSDFASCNKRGTNDTNVGTKKRKPRPSRRAIDIQESPLEEGYSCAEIFRHDLPHDHLSPGKYFIGSIRNEVSNTNEGASSSFEKPDLDNSSEESSDKEQVVFKGLGRFCLERDSQILNSGEPSLEEHVVRSKISMLELMRKRDTSEFDPG